MPKTPDPQDSALQDLRSNTVIMQTYAAQIQNQLKELLAVLDTIAKEELHE